MRKVFESRSISGIRGLFDTFAMVCSLAPGENAAEVAKRNGWEMGPNPWLENEPVAKAGNHVSAILE